MSFVQEYKSDLLRYYRRDRPRQGRPDHRVSSNALARKDVISLPAATEAAQSSASHFVCDIVKGASYKRDSKFKIMSLVRQHGYAARVFQRR